MIESNEKLTADGNQKERTYQLRPQIGAIAYYALARAQSGLVKKASIQAEGHPDQWLIDFY